MRNRIQVIHGVNLDQLGRRDPEHYGTVTLGDLDRAVGRAAHELRLEVTFDQTNHEGEYVELLHRSPEVADALILNPGAWTHYSWAIRDALEISGLPAVEVHLSAVEEREEWRRTSVIRDLCAQTIAGKGVDGYIEALEVLHRRLSA